MMRQSITVAIVTRNRAESLRECLRSLVAQTFHPDNILVINNNSNDNTHDVIVSFSGALQIREVLEKATGYPVVYNRALKEAKTPWIVFIDDDCVAGARWFYYVVAAIHKYPRAAAILGPSFNYYPTNVYACAFQFSNEWWRLRSIKGNKIVNYEVLDSRNIIYNNMQLKKDSITFDSAFTHGAEDSDLGMQIAHNGLEAVYDNRMIIYHKEPTTYKDYRYKKQRYLVSGFDIQNKWGSASRSVQAPHYYMQTIRLFTRCVKRLAYIYAIQCFVIVLTDFIYTKIIRQQ